MIIVFDDTVKLFVNTCLAWQFVRCENMRIVLRRQQPLVVGSDHNLVAGICFLGLSVDILLDTCLLLPASDMLLGKLTELFALQAKPVAYWHQNSGEGVSDFGLVSIVTKVDLAYFLTIALWFYFFGLGYMYFEPRISSTFGDAFEPNDLLRYRIPEIRSIVILRIPEWRICIREAN